MPRSRTAAVLLALFAVASPVTAQEDASPLATEAPNGVASRIPARSTALQKLGGAWTRTSPGPFGATDLPGGWTGTELVVVDPDAKRRAAAYVPSLDEWRRVARPSWKLEAGSNSHWTGEELLFVEPRGAGQRGLAAYDPVKDAWRSTSPAPFNEIVDFGLGRGSLVAMSALGALALYDAATDEWSEIPALPTPSDTAEPTVRLHSTGSEILAAIRGQTLAFATLDIDSREWSEPAISPLSPESAEALWIGDSFLVLTESAEALDEPGPSEAIEGAEPGEPTEAEATDVASETDDADEVDPTVEPTENEVARLDGRYDPIAATWTEVENRCGIDTTDAVWTGSLVLDASRRRALEPVEGLCTRLPKSRWPDRSDALSVWTEDGLVQMSGSIGKAGQPRRDGLVYDPDAHTRRIALDKPARPVRVRVPSLGIDLAVIWDGRKVDGSTPGYPACGVAEYWSVFGLPGTPGTTWINAHAQSGMFLPLLNTYRASGRDALLGRKVELQLRDGRLLTYRTYRANPRATNANIGTKGLKNGEHRLVLQTSTGFGSDPKLLVAARLVSVTKTKEPRPKPNPRACG